MNWKTTLSNWKKGIHPKMPKNIKHPFIWRTSYINNKLNSVYKEEFIENSFLIH